MASFFEADGTDGPGLPLVLAPALGCDGRSFAGLAPLAHGRRVLFWNPPNLWADGRGLGIATSRLLDDVERAGAGDRFVLGGASLGGIFAAAAALENPERVTGLVLFGAAPAWSELFWGLRACRLLHPLLPRRTYHRWFGRILLPTGGPFARRGEWADDLRQQLERRTKDYVDGVLRALLPDAGFDLRPRLSELRCPTLVLQGTRDPIVSLAAAHAWTALPDVQFELLDGAGHMPYLRDADRLLPTIDRFLGRLDRSPS